MSPFSRKKVYGRECPDGFYRKGNVEVFCSYHGIPLYEDLEKAIKDIQVFFAK
jgi:hypothetical protein